MAMKELSDEIIERGAQDYWLARIGGGSPYANVLEALGPAACERFPTNICLLAGPYQGIVIKPDQQRRIANKLAERGCGIVKTFGAVASDNWRKRWI
jgi:hypothetical protein